MTEFVPNRAPGLRDEDSPTEQELADRDIVKPGGYWSKTDPNETWADFRARMYTNTTRMEQKMAKDDNDARSKLILDTLKKHPAISVHGRIEATHERFDLLNPDDYVTARTCAGYYGEPKVLTWVLNTLFVMGGALVGIITWMLVVGY